MNIDNGVSVPRNNGVTYVNVNVLQPLATNYTESWKLITVVEIYDNRLCVYKREDLNIVTGTRGWKCFRPVQETSMDSTIIREFEYRQRSIYPWWTNRH